MEELLNSALTELKKQIPDDLVHPLMSRKPSFQTDQEKKGHLVFHVSDATSLKKIRSDYAAPIRTKLKSIMGRDLAVEFKLCSEPGVLGPSFGMAALNPHFTLDRFSRAGCNELAFDAVVSAKEHPGRTSPLVITADVGLGKTHLLHALAHALQKEADLAPCLVSLPDFQEELTSALQGKRMLDFKQAYRGKGALFVDDLQSLKGAADVVQEEFLHLFNHYYEKGLQVTLACDRPVGQLAVSNRLLSRLTSGLQVVNDNPDKTLREHILTARMQELGVRVSGSAVKSYAERLSGNVRELESLATHLYFLSGRGVNVSDPATALRHLVHSSQREIQGEVPLEKIVDVVCRRYGVSRTEILGSSRRSEFALPRHIAMYLAVKYSGLNKSAVARYFRKSDHTTVINAQKKVTKKVERDSRFQMVLESIVHDLGKTSV